MILEEVVSFRNWGLIKINSTGIHEVREMYNKAAEATGKLKMGPHSYKI